MFQKFTNIIIRYKKILLLGFLVVVFFAFFSDFSFAAGASEGNLLVDKEGMANLNETITTVVTWFNFLAEGVSVLVAIFTFLITMFLSPEWVNGTFFGLGSYIKEIWILVSNIVYFIFAFLLIGIAFINIVGGAGSEKFQLKQALPKLIIGILIVPFSWFIVNFAISVSSILTISALNLPYDTFSGYSETMKQIEIPKKCRLNMNSTTTSTDSEKTNEEQAKKDKWLDCGDGEEGSTVTVGDLMNSSTSSSGIFGTIGLYTYGVLNIESFAKISKNEAEMIKTVADLVIKVGFDLLFVLLYSILLVALGLVLMIRGIRLWLYMMFSPLFGLMFFFDVKEGESTFAKFNIKTFLGLAMVPVYCMLALSFGMLFIYVVGSGMASSDGKFPDTFVTLKQGEGDDEGAQVISVGGSKNENEKVELVINGAISSPDGNISGFVEKIAEGSLGIIGSFIVKILGLVVLWSAMISAMKSSTITKTIIEPLEGFGKKVGEIAQASPQYLPVFGGQSMQSMTNIGRDIEGVFNQKASDQARRFTENNPFFSSSEWSRDLREIVNEVKNTPDKKSFSRLVEKMLREAKGDKRRIIEGYQNVMEAAKTNGRLGMQDIKTENIGSIGEVLKSIKELNGNELKSNKIIGANLSSETELVNFSSGGSTSEDGENKNNPETASTEDKANKISIGNQNINVTKDGDGKITEMSIDTDSKVKDLIENLQIGMNGNKILKSRIEFVNELLRKYEDDGMTQEMAEKIALQIEDSSSGGKFDFDG